MEVDPCGGLGRDEFVVDEVLSVGRSLDLYMARGVLLGS